MTCRLTIFGSRTIVKMRGRRARIERLPAAWQALNEYGQDPGRLPGSGSFYWPTVKAAYRAAVVTFRADENVEAVKIEGIQRSAGCLHTAERCRSALKEGVMKKNDYLLGFWILFFVASFTVLIYGQTVSGPQLATAVSSSSAPLSPAEAARVMMGAAMQSNRTNPQPAPQAALPSIVVPSTPGAAYWMPMPKPAEPKRLDGTPITMPPATYGGSTLVVLEVGK